MALLVMSCLTCGVCLGGATGECQDGMHHLSIHTIVSGEYAESATGFVFKRETIGLCEDAVYVPEEPISYSIGDFNGLLVSCTASVDLGFPHEGVVYRYTPYFVNVDESLSPVTSNDAGDARTYALVSCGYGPFVRGELRLDSSSIIEPLWSIDPCEEDCWSEPALDIMTTEEMLTALGSHGGDLVGQIVDGFGNRTYGSMIGGDLHEIVRIEPAPSGSCGPVPAEPMSWDAVKSFYR
jgi:hypothetical protein